MIAARLHKYHEALQLESIAEPRATEPHDVIVRVGGAGLCRTDLHVQEGQWAVNSQVELPYVLGHENAGWVHEIGSAVTNVAVGDTVILHPLVTCGLCRACRAGDDVHCERHPDLQLSQRQVARALNAHRLALPLTEIGENVGIIPRTALDQCGERLRNRYRQAPPVDLEVGIGLQEERQNTRRKHGHLYGAERHHGCDRCGSGSERGGGCHEPPPLGVSYTSC